jgi:hypothetical protein
MPPVSEKPPPAPHQPIHAPRNADAQPAHSAPQRVLAPRLHDQVHMIESGLRVARTLSRRRPQRGGGARASSSAAYKPNQGVRRHGGLLGGRSEAALRRAHLPYHRDAIRALSCDSVSMPHGTTAQPRSHSPTPLAQPDPSPPGQPRPAGQLRFAARTRRRQLRFALPEVPAEARTPGQPSRRAAGSRRWRGETPRGVIHLNRPVAVARPRSRGLTSQRP